MANVNFFSRIGNLWSGFLSLFIADIETKHPEIAYENAINALVGKYTKLKAATAAIIRRRDELSSRFAQLSRDHAQVSTDLSNAVATGQDDLALVLIQKKNTLEANLQELKAEAEQANKDADEAKSSLLTVKSEIDKLKSEKDVMLAKMNSAKARLQINDQLEGLSVDAEVQTLERVREHIKNKVSEANLGQELRDSDLDVRLRKLREKGGDITAQSQLAELKRQHAAAGAQAAKQM
jgi:phage shock protein A